MIKLERKGNKEVTEQELTWQKEEKKHIDVIFWGGVILWAGFIFGIEYFRYLPHIGTANSWSWIFLGAGIYGVLISIIRILSVNFSHPAAWDWIWAVVFLVIGAAGFLAISVSWWLSLIIFGLVILASAFKSSGKDSR